MADIRTFETGATRNDDPDRVEWFRMLSLPVMFAYADYMSRHRQTPAGLRDFDNWKGADGKGGFPYSQTAESLGRHVLDLAALTQGETPMRECDIPDTCCAIMFNAMAHLHRYLNEMEG